ncbi:hypothetical protein [Winogradskyella sp. A2]|uniref:hypothetical protein n=1 Tax=Winogradskyella sp. A2 TaxID=3366944 RepID=UPI00398C5BBE
MKYRIIYILVLMVILALIYNCRETKEKNEDAIENAADAATDATKDAIDSAEDAVKEAVDAAKDAAEDVLPKYELGECVMHDNKKAVVMSIDKSPLVETGDFIYKIEYQNGLENEKGIPESNLSDCI